MTTRWIVAREPAPAEPPAAPRAAETEAPRLSAPLRELLTWVARGERTYGETMAAWRSSCPRLAVWEDALDDRLVRVEAGPSTRMDEARVLLTERGHAALASG